MSQLQQYGYMDGTCNTNKKTVNKNQGKNTTKYVSSSLTSNVKFVKCSKDLIYYRLSYDNKITLRYLPHSFYLWLY